ncbi:MAG TPA: bacterio-opsin activator [Deltaproteobacteria bacterium]|nr:bacterio-opsin activator [Deltaproteobacteria bacterium]
MVVLGPEEMKRVDPDAMAMRVFLKALEILGGPRKLVEYRNLTWLPSLLEAAYAVVLSEEFMKTEDDIAQFLGLTRQTVRNILRADPDLVMKKLEGELEDKSLKAHTAGGLAKLAHREVKEGRDNLTLFVELVLQGSEALGIFWPAEVLRRIKGLDFPVGKEELLDRLKGLKVKDRDVSEVLTALNYPVKNPAQLLKEMREALER